MRPDSVCEKKTSPTPPASGQKPPRGRGPFSFAVICEQKRKGAESPEGRNLRGMKRENGK
jgi:hypothetical protein